MDKKPTLLVPIAGRGQRFVDAGYTNPKSLIVAAGKHIIDHSFDSIIKEEYNIVFIVRGEHVRNFAIDDVLRKKYGENIKIVVSDKMTQGSVCSCLLAEDIIDKDSPLFIYTLDVKFEPIFSCSDIPDCDGAILTFKANSPAYSYARLNNDGNVEETAEKSVISEHAAVGLYYFRTASIFFDSAKSQIRNAETVNGEYYICPVYNYLIRAGMKVRTVEVEKMYLMGTPNELNFFVEKISPEFGKKSLALCSDHSGFECKEFFKTILDQRGISYIDFGCFSEKPCDYNDYLFQATKHIKSGICDFGFGFCRTGQGINIAANKCSGIRSALIYDEYTAEYARRHNAANFFSFPSRERFDKLSAVLGRIIENTFDGGRHLNRVLKAEGNEAL